MHFCRLLLLCLNWMLALGWLWRGVASLRNLPGLPDLLSAQYAPGSANPSPDQKTPTLSVIVPARDEARAVGATLESLLATEGLAIEIFAVDDRSTDATGEIMEAIKARHESQGKEQIKEDGMGASIPDPLPRPSLSVLHVERLPEGWMGKTHAMAAAAKMVRAPCLLFTDADVVYRPDTLVRAMRFLESEQADHLVLVPTVILRSAGERMMIAFLQVVSVWLARPWRVADPDAPHDFVGIGAFNLIRRDVYEQIGGFESLRLEVLEDVRLGFKVKRGGYKQRIAFGRDLVRIRWAHGAIGVVGNLTKNAFSAFRFRLILLLAACAGLAIQAILPVAGLLFGWPMRCASLVSVAMILMLYHHFKRHTDTGIIYAATFPLAGLFLVYALLRSMTLTLVQGGVRWRGTFYPLRKLRQHCGPLW